MPLHKKDKAYIYYTPDLDSRYAAGLVYRYLKENGYKEITISNTHLENYKMPKNPVNDTVAIICGAIPYMRMFDDALKAFNRDVIVFENTSTYIKYLKLYNWNPRGLMYENIALSKLAYLYLYNKYRMGKENPWHQMFIPDKRTGGSLVDFRGYQGYDSSVLNIGNEYPYINTLNEYHNNKFIGVVKKSLLYYLENEFSPFSVPDDKNLDVGYIINENVDSDVIDKSSYLYKTRTKDFVNIEKNGGIFPVKLRKFSDLKAVAVNYSKDDPEIFKHSKIFNNYHIGILFHLEYGKMYYSVYRLNRDPDRYINIENICISYGGKGTSNYGSFIISSGMLEVTPLDMHP